LPKQIWLLKKPYSMAELAAAVDAALHASNRQAL
jgi:DNA-binding response OmpR family regulator